MNVFINRSVKCILAVLFIGTSIIPVHAQWWKKGIETLGKKSPLTKIGPTTHPAVNPYVPPALLQTSVFTLPRVVSLPVTVEQQVIKARHKPRLLSVKESEKILFPQTKKGNLFYVPLALNTPQTAVYRGMSLPNLEALENIAKNGLELSKIQFRNATEYAIFTSNRLELALHYTRSLSDEKEALPVIVKIPVTQQCKPLGYNGHFVFVQDVPAKYISEIMVLLEMDGKPLWYKVVWQNDKMDLVPAPSKQFTAGELMIHYFKAWPINLDMD